MKRTTISHYFKKEIDIDWDGADNRYGEPIDNVQQTKGKAGVVLERLSESALQKYMNAKISSPGVMRPKYTEECSRCKKKFKNKGTLICHSRYCGKERNLQCAHCSYKTKHKINLIVHLSKIHPEGKKAKQSEQDGKSKFKRICEKCKEVSVSLCPSKCERCFNKLLYQCNKCGKQFKTYSLAYYHWDTRCGVKGYFNCSKCDFKSVWRTKVIQHMKRLHLCSEWSEEFQSINWIGLDQSSNENLASISHKCPKCPKIMKNAKHLARHVQFCGGLKREKNSDIALENNVISIRSELNKCSSCGQEFDHVYSLNRHRIYCKKMPLVTKITNDSDVEVVETDEDLFKSPIPLDKQRARTREMMVKYCGKCHEESAIEEGYGVSRKESCQKCKTTLSFKCKKCFKACTGYANILAHLKYICDPQEQFKCSKCDYKASSSYYVKRHYREVHRIDCNVECKKCGSKFKSSDYLKRHMRRCGVEAKFQCEHCPFKSKMKIYLRKHIFRSHMEPVVIDRGESIKMSWQRFSRAKIHLTAHCFECKKEQPLGYRLKICRDCKTTLSFKCKKCKKKYFSNDENACNHVIGYLETIKFECKRCGRGAISEKSLWMHEHTCGAEATFRCRFCKYAGKQKGNVVNHEKKMHPHKF